MITCERRLTIIIILLVNEEEEEEELLFGLETERRQKGTTN